MPTSYFWPIDNTRARAVSLTAYGSGILIPKWTDPVSWYYDGVSTTLAVSSAYVAGVPYGAGPYGGGPWPSGPLAGGCGFSASCTDGASGAWLTQYSGAAVHQLSGGTFAVYGLPAGCFTGVAYSSTYNNAYMCNSSGQIYTPVGSGLTYCGTFFVPGSGIAYGGNAYGSGAYSSLAGLISVAWEMQAYQNTLYTLSPGILVSFVLSGPTSGVANLQATPMAIPTCIAISSGGRIAIGGWSQAAIGSTSGTSGIYNVAFDPLLSNMLALRPAAGRVDLYGGAQEQWTLTQSLSGIANPTYAAWRPNGIGAIVTDPIAGNLYQLLYSLGVLSITQTVPLTGAGAVTIQPDSITAFICVSGANLLRQYNFQGPSWVSGATFALTGVSTILTTPTPSGAVAGYSSGVAFLTGSQQNYTITNNVPLPYRPNALTTDLYGNVVAVGTIGVSGGIMTSFTGVTSGAPILWQGNAIDVIYCQGQIVVMDTFNNMLRYYSQLGPGQPYTLWNTKLIDGNYSIPTSGINLAISPMTNNASGGTVFTMTSGGSGLAYQSQFVGPYNLSAITSGIVSIMTSGGTWASLNLRQNDTPTALCFDGSGNVQVATQQNFLYSVSPSGTLITSAGIPVYTRQIQTTTLGISDMIYALGHVWGSSSLNGSLIELT